MSNRPRPSQSPERRPTRRQLASQQREANVQRRAVIAIGGAVGLALLLIISGLVYDRLIQPNRTLKRVNNVTLTRGGYEDLARANTIQQIIQGLQFSKLFGANQSLGQSGRFDEQIVQANVQLSEIGTSRYRQQPVDDATVNQWVDQQILEQGAKEQFSLEPQQGEIDQEIVAQFGALLDTTTPVTATETTTATETAETAAAAATSAAATTTAVAGTPTATALPTATPLPEEATQKVNEIVDVLYTEYTNILEALPEGALERQRTPQVSQEEMLRVLRESSRQQVLRERVGAALVKELPANDTAKPTSITVRHILLQVPQPTPTPAPADETSATETAEPEATATTVPTPSPTPSPEELEQLFAERKTEADAIYKQLAAAPDSFATVAQEKSEDPGSAANGGKLDPFDREGNVVGSQGQTLVKPFVDAAWQLKENEISQPVRTDFGWHIIQRVPEDPEEKLDRLRNEALDKWLEERRQQAEIDPPPTATPTVEATEPAAPSEATTQPETATTTAP
jgi:hypothetical protein